MSVSQNQARYRSLTDLLLVQDQLPGAPAGVCSADSSLVRQTKRLVAQLQRLGHKVTLEPLSEVA
jgi:hypothetical protein